MITNFNSTSKGGSNTGSCGNLTSYLDKEQENAWFNATDKDIKTEKVTAEIDGMGRGGIKKHEWGFIEIEYNPSTKEQQNIIETATGRTDVSDWNQLSQSEKEQVKAEFAEFVRDAQDIQAKHYGRDKVQGGEDLKYFAKIETQRKYKGLDERVKKGEVKQGQLKEGLNMHAHIVQHRKTIDKKTKLSPEATSKEISKKNPVKAGFDRNGFYNKIEQRFDQKYSHNREVKETFEWRNAKKNNRKEDMQLLEERAKGTGHKTQRAELLQKMQNRPIEKQQQTNRNQQQQRRNDRGMSR
jgi:hypothetical protein